MSNKLKNSDYKNSHPTPVIICVLSNLNRDSEKVISLAIDNQLSSMSCNLEIGKNKLWDWLTMRKEKLKKCKYIRSLIQHNFPPNYLWGIDGTNADAFWAAQIFTLGLEKVSSCYIRVSSQNFLTLLPWLRK
jgi:hypothetical protein